MIERLRNILKSHRAFIESKIDNYRQLLRKDYPDIDSLVTKTEIAEFEKRCRARLIRGLSFLQLKQHIHEITPEKTDKISTQIKNGEAILANDLPNFTKAWKQPSFGLLMDLREKWANSAGSQKERNNRTSFYNQHIITPIRKRTNSLIKEDPIKVVGKNLGNPHIKTLADFVNEIGSLLEAERKKKPSRTRGTHISYFNSILSFFCRPYAESLTLHVLTIPTSLTDVLDMLVNKALKSSSLRPYKHLFLCYALIYVPIKFKQLLELPAPDQKKLCLRYGNLCFPVSQLFIDLWKCFGESDRLFHRDVWDEFNVTKPEKPLNQMIRIWGENVGLSYNLTPTILRSSLYQEVEK